MLASRTGCIAAFFRRIVHTRLPVPSLFTHDDRIRGRQHRWTGLLGALLAVSCRGEDLSFDCEHQMAEFLAVAQAEDVSLGALPPQRPFPAAVHLQEEGLNRLLLYALGEDVPFSGEVPFGILPQGPGTASFAPESAPRVVVRPVGGCPECVVYQLDFRVSLTSSDEPVSTGAGWVELAIPLELRRDPFTGIATVVAHYDRASIDDWAMSVFGFDSEEHDSFAGAAKLFLEAEIRAGYGAVELLTLDPWVLGSGAMLAAQELLVDTTHHQLVFGLTSNLPIPGAAVDLAAPPPATPIGVSFHGALLPALAKRMLTEGTVPRRYGEHGEPDPAGDYGVTLSALRPSTSERLSADLRIWRIADGYCGRAAVELPLELALDATAQALELTPGPASLVLGHPDNQGAGVAAEEDASLVAEHRDLLSTFADTLSEELTQSLRFPEFNVPGTQLLFSLSEVAMGPALLDLAIDVRVFQAEDS